MYHDIGKKIKQATFLIFIITTITIVLIAIVLIALLVKLFQDDSVLAVLLVLMGSAISILFAWISSWLLYAYGEMVDKLTAIEKTLESKPSTKRLIEKSMLLHLRRNKMKLGKSPHPS